jgi:hypothetical protein
MTKTYQAPPVPKGMRQFDYYGLELSAGKEELPVVCHIEYSPNTPDTWTEPGDPGHFFLFAAYVRDVNICELIAQEHLTRIENEFIDWVHEDDGWRHDDGQE